jgi:uncharacterized protein YcbK (DUF882 family)
MQGYAGVWMRILRAAGAAAVAMLLSLAGSGAAMAMAQTGAQTMAQAMAQTGALPAPGTMASPDAEVVAGTRSKQVYRLHLHHLHTGERLDVVYRIGDAYVPSGIDALNHFLRDHWTQDVSDYDPREFDLLHTILVKLRRPNAVIDIVCGYRSPWSNALLRQGSDESGVAEHSQHMLAKAIDIRVPGVSTARLRDAARSLDAGGVGYYPRSRFVHVDVGPVRTWSFGAGPGGRMHRARGHHVRGRGVVRRTGV